MQLIFQSHSKFEESKKMNLQIDPWENYLYYDSKFFFDFLFAKNLSQNIKEKSVLLTYDSIEEKFIAMKFLMYVYHNDLMANFKIEGRSVWWKLVEYLKGITSEEGKLEESFLFNFIRNVLIRKIEPKEEEVNQFETA